MCTKQASEKHTDQIKMRAPPMGSLIRISESLCPIMFLSHSVVFWRWFYQHNSLCRSQEIKNEVPCHNIVSDVFSHGSWHAHWTVSQLYSDGGIWLGKGQSHCCRWCLVLLPLFCVHKTIPRCTFTHSFLPEFGTWRRSLIPRGPVSPMSLKQTISDSNPSSR